MKIEIEIRVSGNRLLFSAPQHGISFEEANVIFYEASSRNKMWILAGEATPDKIVPYLDQRYKTKFAFSPLIEADSFEVKFALGALAYCKSSIYRKIHPRARWFFESIDKIHCSLWLSKYATIPQQTRNKFEFQANTQLHLQLTINGQPAGWKQGQLILAIWSGVIFPPIVMFVSFAIMTLLPAYVAQSLGFSPQIINFWGGAILFIAMLIALGMSFLLGEIAWMLVMRRFLPKTLMRQLLLRNAGRIENAFLIPLVNKFLPDPDMAQ